MRLSQSIRRAVITLSALSCGLGVSADAAALYFVRVEIKGVRERTCYDFALKAATDQGFTGIRRGQFEVVGQKNGVYLSTTCVGRGTLRAMAVVMAMGDSFQAAQQVANEFATQVSRMTCFDGPC